MTAFRQQPRLPASGMTLLEVLIVIAIMAILLGMANLSFQGGGQRQNRFNGEKLTAQINHVTLLTTLHGAPMGLALSDHEYQFMRRNKIADSDYDWVPASQPSLQPINLRANEDKFKLTLDGTPLTLSAKLPDTPQLLFAASTELPDFEIFIGDSETGSPTVVTAGPDRFLAIMAAGASLP